MEKKAIIIFDFCETIVPFQTGDDFLRWVIFSHSSFEARLVTFVIMNRFCKKLLQIINPNKKIRDYLLPMVKGIAIEKINYTASEYARIILVPNINAKMKKLLEYYEDKGLKIMIVSGGYEEYLKYVFKEKEKIEIIGTKLDYSEGCTNGKIDGKVCMGIEKVNRIYKNNKNFGDEIDQEKSAVYSDCMSDLPIFSLVTKNKWLVKLPRKRNGIVKFTKLVS